MSLLHEAHLRCQSKVGYAMADGFEKIFVANTNTTTNEMKPYIKMAEENGYRIVYIIVENRHGNKNIHNVPEGTLEAMRARFSIEL